MTREECIRERMDRGLSVAAAAELMGMSNKTLARFEEGGDVHIANAKKIADFYGVKVTDILPLEPLEPAA